MKHFQGKASQQALNILPFPPHQHHPVLSTVEYVQQGAETRNSSTQQSQDAGAICNEDW